MSFFNYYYNIAWMVIYSEKWIQFFDQWSLFKVCMYVVTTCIYTTVGLRFSGIKGDGTSRSRTLLLRDENSMAVYNMLFFNLTTHSKHLKQPPVLWTSWCQHCPELLCLRELANYMSIYLGTNLTDVHLFTYIHVPWIVALIVMLSFRWIRYYFSFYPYTGKYGIR